MLLDLIRAGVAVYSPHTAFDNCDGGINDRVQRLLDLSDAPSTATASSPNKRTVWLYALAAPVILVLATNRDVLYVVHHAYETVVHLLQ